MFVNADNYLQARERFKVLLEHLLTNEPNPIFDELIEITELGPDGIVEDTNSHIEFSDTWLKELGVTIDILPLRK